MSARGLLFGRVADSYEEFRLDYPEELANTVLAYAEPPLHRALEVGPGTGKATRLFAGRGLSVTACEPDPLMAGLLRRTTAGLNVDIVAATFEQFSTSASASGLPFDLVYAASAWHWTNPETRWDHAAALLRPGGTCAFAGGRPTLADAELQERVEHMQAAVISPDIAHSSPTAPPDGLRWPGSEVAQDARFVDVRQVELPRAVRLSADRYVGYLSTLSAYLQLPPAESNALLGRIRGILPDQVAVSARLDLHLARRAPSSQ